MPRAMRDARAVARQELREMQAELAELEEAIRLKEIEIDSY